jgi:mRNA interferase MazF
MTSGIMLKPTEIVLIPFPFTNLTAVKKRPVLVIKASDKVNDFLCVPLTSQNSHENSVLLADEDLVKGTLVKPSWVRVDKIFTFNMEIVVGRIAELNETSFSKIKQLICQNLECCSEK